jgi:oligopeptide transport system substrate-binding protein
MRPVWSLLRVLVIALPVLTPGSVPIEARQTGAEHVLRVNWGYFPETLDPQLSHSGQWAVSGGLDYEGLTRIDDELQVGPGAAESWEFSDGGKTLTFRLRDGLVFSDGVPVTAEHFRYAVERLCSPELDSKSAIQLFDVVGCQELFTSAGDDAATNAARASLGAMALDERTLEMHFDRPAPYFPVTAASWGTIPIRQDLVEAGGPEWWAKPEFRIGNGPFRLVEYQPEGDDGRLVYARNDRYWGGPTKLDGLEFLFLDYYDPDTMEAYRRGELDVNWPAEEIIPGIEADPVLSQELLITRVPGTNYMGFNLTREPFQDQKVREAFAYAFDREGWCLEIQFGACTPTHSWIAPGAPGAIETAAFAFDPEKAREALAASSYGGPENLPEVVWYVISGDANMERDAQWLSSLYRDVLGVELTVTALSEAELDALYDDAGTWPQMDEQVWWADPDPRDWFIVWRCGSDFNNGYCNPELEAVLDRADAELDPEARIALYEKAGRILVADAPAIFVHQSFGQVLVKPFVTGYSRTALNGEWPGWRNLMTVDVAHHS